MSLPIWKEISDEVVYNGYRKILRRVFELNGGERLDFDLVKEGRAVCVLAVTSENQIVLARQFRPGQGKFLTELPGGGVKEDEEPAIAAARELLEETGYAGEIEFVTESFHSAYSTMVRYNFVVRNCVKIGETQNDEEGEYTEPVLMELPEFRALLKSGQLTDMGTGYRCLDHLGLL